MFMRTYYSFGEAGVSEEDPITWGRLTVAEAPLPDKPKLLEQVRNLMRVRRYSLRTERTYCD